MLTWDLLRCWITSSGEHLMIVCLAYGYSFRTGQWHFSCRNFDPASFPCKNPRCFHSRCCKDNEHDQRAGVPVSEPNVPKTGTFIFMFKLKSWLLKGPMRWHRSLGNNLPNHFLNITSGVSVYDASIPFIRSRTLKPRVFRLKRNLPFLSGSKKRYPQDTLPKKPT